MPNIKEYVYIFIYISFEEYREFIFYGYHSMAGGIKGEGRVKNHSYPKGLEWYINNEILE